jgi:hypothetical protein
MFKQFDTKFGYACVDQRYGYLPTVIRLFDAVDTKLPFAFEEVDCVEEGIHMRAEIDMPFDKVVEMLQK